MATEALHLLLAQHNLVQTVQTRTCEQLVTCLETHFNNSPSGVVTVIDTSSTNPLPQEELAQIISLLINEKCAAWGNSGQQQNWLVPTPHRTLFDGPQSPYTAATLSRLQPI